jgi:hypothetical protein
MTRRRSEYVIGLGLVAVAVLIVLIVLIVRTSSAPAPLPACVDPDTRKRILELTLAGYDQALVQHTAHLFDIWVKDQDPQPKRAQVGTQNGISAYIRARKLAQQWNPPAC